MKTPKRLLTLLASLVIVALIASASMASSGALGHSPTTDSKVLALAGQDDGAPDGATADEGAVCDEDPAGADCEEGPGGDETADDPATDEGTDDTAEVDPDREKACNDAAGIETPEPGTTEEPTTTLGADLEKLHGVDNAIEHVLANCLKNPQAPGLLNALIQLTTGRAKHEAHEAWKAEKKAVRAEAKAAKHGAGKSPDGVHGNPHGDRTHGNPHGEAGHGRGGSHGKAH